MKYVKYIKQIHSFIHSLNEKKNGYEEDENAKM